MTPNMVETSIGSLNYIDGVPQPETVEKIYDFLDLSRGVDAFIKGIPAASIYRLIIGMYELGAEEVHQVVYFPEMLNAKALFLTGGNTTMYAFPTIDLERDGPTVLELPKGMLGAIDDAWFRFTVDLGPLGPDRGQGGKYLILPPGYEGEIPEEGYFIVHSRSYTGWMAIRASVKNGVEAAATNIKNNLKLYPYSKRDNPPKMELLNMSGKPLNSIHANDFEFYKEVNSVIQKEPLDFIDAETRGLFASIGIEKGKPFNPNARMKKILVNAAAIGNGAIRSTVWQPRTEGTMKGIEVYPGQNSMWTMGWVDKNTFFNGKDGHTFNADACAYFHYFATAVTPAMAVEIPGKGSDYALGFVDSENRTLDGSKTYKVHMPANVPVVDFWSFTVFDPQTRSMLQETSQDYPAIVSFSSDYKKNEDGSIDIYFGPEAPEGFENNWIETTQGKSWFTVLRVYGPTEEWLNRNWRLGEIELVK